jgi:hypothetical protein
MQRNLRKYIRENLVRVFTDILHDAVENAPEKSGLLKYSLILTGEAEGGTGFTFGIYGTHYTYYQEYGFKHRQAGWIEGKHFIRDAEENHKSDLSEAISDAIEEAVIRGE